MCVVSNIIDYAKRQWGEPWYTPNQPWPNPSIPERPTPLPYIPTPMPNAGPTKEQFEELLKLLRAAKRFDEATNQPDCELDEKKRFLKRLAEWIGVPIDDKFFEVSEK